MDTTSHKHRNFKIVFNLAVVCAFLFFVYENNGAKFDLCSRGTHVAQLGDGQFSFRIFDTPTLRERGLSGREQLQHDEGVLFVFDMPTEIGFWMKDMLIPIDIIFLDHEYRVVGLVSDARPESYPKLFVSPPMMRYTIEVPSGTIARHQIAIESVVTIDTCDVLQ